MKFQFKYLFLIFILLLGSSCNNTNYKKVDNLETSTKSINTVNYSINEKFNNSQINCILIGKFIDRTDISKFKDLNKISRDYNVIDQENNCYLIKYTDD